MFKPKTIAADYLGVYICLNPPGMFVYACRYYITIIYTSYFQAA
jgi:hypothetical protein